MNHPVSYTVIFADFLWHSFVIEPKRFKSPLWHTILITKKKNMYWYVENYRYCIILCILITKLYICLEFNTYWILCLQLCTSDNWNIFPYISLRYFKYVSLTYLYSHCKKYNRTHSQSLNIGFFPLCQGWESQHSK